MLLWVHRQRGWRSLAGRHARAVQRGASGSVHRAGVAGIRGYGNSPAQLAATKPTGAHALLARYRPLGADTMNLRNIFKREQRSADPSWDALTGGGNNTDAGAYVDSKSAESISAVFAFVQALSESTACLP